MSVYHVGLDYHLRTSTFVILDEYGKELQTRTIRGHCSAAVSWLKDWARERTVRVCMEASCGYGPLRDQLSTFAQVTVVHPGRVRLIFQSKRKNDRIDATKLAKLLYLGEAPAVHVPKLEVRAWREMIEFRRREVDKQTRIKNQLCALLRGQGIAVPKEVGGLWTKRGQAWLTGLSWPTPQAAMRRDILLEQLSSARRVIGRVTQELDRIAAEHAGVKLLRTIPGVGPRTAEAVAAYVDDPHRFARANRLGAYFGLVPSQDSSAGVNRLGHITKQGPATVRKLLTEAAWRSIRECNEFKAAFERITAGKDERRRIALIAVAHKLVRTMLGMLKSGEEFNVQRLTPNSVNIAA